MVKQSLSTSRNLKFEKFQKSVREAFGTFVHTNLGLDENYVYVWYTGNCENNWFRIYYNDVKGTLYFEPTAKYNKIDPNNPIFKFVEKYIKLDNL